MKKTVAAALAVAFVMGASATPTFAAANPFSDVPAGHWAYGAVATLAQEGIIEGYGDGTYRGDRLITRYEMAQMIAKALAKTDNPYFSEYMKSVNEGAGGPESVRRSPHAVKADLDRLKAEFADELEALGVRVSELEKHDDNVIWQGKIEYTYKNHKTDNLYDEQRRGHHSTDGHTRVKQDDWIFRFEPIAVVNGEEDPDGKVVLENGHPIKDPVTGELKRKATTYRSLWTLRARIDAHVDLSRDTNSSFELVRGWAQGDYKNFQVKVGRQPLYTNEDGIVWDTEYTGAEITLFQDRAGGLRGTLYGGRIAAGKVGGGIRHAGAWDGRQDGGSGEARFADAAGTIGSWGEDPTSFIGLNIQYDKGGKGLFGGLGYYGLKDDDFKYINIDGERFANTFYSRHGNTDKAQIWSVNAGYRLGKAQLWGAYAKNSKADYEAYSWQALLKYGDLYGGGNQGTHKGQWAVWAGYKRLGTNSSPIAINWDDAYAGTKGFVAGASWAPMDRIVVLAKYFKGKYITGPGDAERLFGRVEFFY